MSLVSLLDRRLCAKVYKAGSSVAGSVFLISIISLPAATAQSASVKTATPQKLPIQSKTAYRLKSYSEELPGAAVKVEMIAIPAGTFKTASKAVVIKPFWIASTETTWEAFDAFMASGKPSPAYDQTPYDADAIARPSKSYILPDLGWGHHGFPAINISYLSATMFCRWLSSKTGKKYRLPMDIEWEYACRAGSSAPFKMTAAQIAKSAWYAANSDLVTHPVAKKMPNAWKLYDMLGSVGEWATDTDSKPVLCGGTFKDQADKINPTTRRKQTAAWQATDPQLPKSRWWLSDGMFVGFRIVCEP